jgi:simple sugar transport system permease protein
MADGGAPAPVQDERVKEISGFRQGPDPPGTGGIVGTIAVFTFFLLFAADSGMFNAQGVMNWSPSRPSS